jgi:hypothetical protein
MTNRAESSGVRLTRADAAIAKGMIARGDRHHDIAAWFDSIECNGIMTNPKESCYG